MEQRNGYATLVTIRVVANTIDNDQLDWPTDSTVRSLLISGTTRLYGQATLDGNIYLSAATQHILSFEVTLSWWSQQMRRDSCLKAKANQSHRTRRVL